MLDKLQEYFFGRKIASYQSEHSGQVEVWQTGTKKVLHSANANLSYDGLHVVFQEVFSAIKLKDNPPKKVLLLGLAGGSVVSILRDELRINCPVVAVDYDKVLIDIAREHFGINRFKGLTIHYADAYNYVANEADTYDMVVVDLFNDNKVPLKFFSDEFNNHLLRLCPQGRILFNTMVIDAGYAQRIGNLKTFYRDRVKMLTSVFPNGDNEVLVAQTEV